MIPKVASIGVVAILLFDLIASLASRSLGFDYARASFGSYLIYLLIGFFAARGAPQAPLRAAAICAAVAGLAEGTLGWWMSTMIGPGRLDAVNPAEMTVVIAMVVLFSTLIGLVSGLIGRFFRPRTPAT